MEGILEEARYLIGVLLSVVLGFCIGFERKTRSKEAGIKTHTIVCLGSALMMVVSKHAFSVAEADLSRVAASIVSGVSFLGAGIIVYRKNVVSGLTTAAGVWATAGIGMACGAELYVVAVGATIIMIAVQCLLHINCKLLNAKRTYELKICFIQEKDQNKLVKDIFNVQHFKKVSIVHGDKIVWTVHLNTETEYSTEKLDVIMKEYDFITMIERVDEC